jgi:GH43 family beta-xylosidase
MMHKEFLIVLFISLLACSKKSNTQTTTPPVSEDTIFTNPLLPSGPDPWVIQKDTTYYYTNTLGNRIALYATGKMSALNRATIANIWTPPLSGPYSKEIWAPEVHYIGNKWYTYFAADDGNNNNHRIYVIECDDANPLTGTWVFKGKVSDTVTDKWAIDASVFEYNSQLYMIWSGWPGDINTEQDIFIARMKDPLTLESTRVMISTPSATWEKSGAPPAVNEGPEALTSSGGQLFLTFSASGCWTDGYSLGLLTLRNGGDPTNPADWTKSTGPVFSTNAGNGAFAPGHNGFFKSRDGTEDWIIYHANTLAGQGCGDARNPRMQKYSWNADGTPDFGFPVRINSPLRKPSGE